MMVSITKAEYEAIMFCREQVTGAIEGASDENYVKEASEAIEGIVSFRKKYLKAVAKPDLLATAFQVVATTGIFRLPISRMVSHSLASYNSSSFKRMNCCRNIRMLKTESLHASSSVLPSSTAIPTSVNRRSKNKQKERQA